MESIKQNKYLNIFVRILLSVFSCLLVLLCCLFFVFTSTDQPTLSDSDDVAMMDQFDSIITDALSKAEEAALDVQKHFWVNEDAEVGPVPDPDRYGATNDPSSLQWLLDDAQGLLDGQNTLFSTEIDIRPGSEVLYYLDDSILAITWKQVFANCVYTISEIKISDPSQFRRHLEDDVFDGPTLSTPTLMSQKVNAVVGTSADHYRGRKAGIIVYDGEVKRIDRAHRIDVCYIDVNGNMHFSYRGELMDIESAQKFVDENQIQFSVAFGPILVDDGIRCEPATYAIGEVNEKYARAALCQMDELHYLIVVANREHGYENHLTIHEFAEQIEKFGSIKAYTLDGGNTGSIVMNGKLINKTTLGYERIQGDLMYFCTAIPNTSEKE